MPTSRGTAHLIDLIDHAIDVGNSFRRLVVAVVEDGVVTPDERRLLSSAAREANQSEHAMVGRAQQVDAAMLVIGALAGAGRVSDHVYRMTRETYQDTKRISA